MNSKQDTTLPKQFYIQALLTIIQEGLNQLHIIRKINNWPDPIKDAQQFSYKTIEERYFVNESDKIEGSNEHQNISNTIFHKNCTLMESILIILQEELTKSRSFEQFSVIVESFIKMKNDDEEFLAKVLEKGKELKELEETFETEKIDLCTKIGKCMSEIGKLKDSIEVSFSLFKSHNWNIFLFKWIKLKLNLTIFYFAID